MFFSQKLIFQTKLTILGIVSTGLATSLAATDDLRKLFQLGSVMNLGIQVADRIGDGAERGNGSGRQGFRGGTSKSSVQNFDFNIRSVADCKGASERGFGGGRYGNRGGGAIKETTPNFDLLSPTSGVAAK